MRPGSGEQSTLGGPLRPNAKTLAGASGVADLVDDPDAHV
jgi:hypothetical protein